MTLLSKLKNAVVRDGLFLSAIGARICYSSDHPLTLSYNDKRITDKDKRASFLLRLAKAKHFSVFAHSPIQFTYPAKQFMKEYIDLPHKLQTKLFVKRINDEEILILANARHVMEFLTMEEMEVYIKLQVENYFPHVMCQQPSNVIKNAGVICYYLSSQANDDFDWFSFISYEYSVIYSHQHVRHTWQNFSQRSHRYTDVDNVIIPPSILNADMQDKYKEYVEQTLTAYQQLRSKGIHKEDARFITPSGRTTTLMFSGPRFVMQDFVTKRSISKAQWEIRDVAHIVETLLKKVDSKTKQER